LNLENEAKDGGKKIKGPGAVQSEGSTGIYSDLLPIVPGPDGEFTEANQGNESGLYRLLLPGCASYPGPTAGTSVQACMCVCTLVCFIRVLAENFTKTLPFVYRFFTMGGNETLKCS
jgi:hypothetical protein